MFVDSPNVYSCILIDCAFEYFKGNIPLAVYDRSRWANDFWGGYLILFFPYICDLLYIVANPRNNSYSSYCKCFTLAHFMYI